MYTKKNITYIQPMIDDQHKDVLWYNGTVAQMQIDTHTTLSLQATGTVHADILDSRGRSICGVYDATMQGIFAETMKHYGINSDDELMHVISNSLKAIIRDNEIKVNLLTRNIWVAVFRRVTDNPATVQQFSTILASNNIDEAMNQMIKNAEAIVARAENAPDIAIHNTCYVYHHFADDKPYTSQQIRVFKDKDGATAHLRAEVENYFDRTWEKIGKIKGIDHYADNYVSFSDEKHKVFFMVEEKAIR